jgi:predicted RNA-binding Zn-ribbon protein involved in translation (DUF1610 family)
MPLLLVCGGCGSTISRVTNGSQAGQIKAYQYALKGPCPKCGMKFVGQPSIDVRRMP